MSMVDNLNIPVKVSRQIVDQCVDWRSSKTNVHLRDCEIGDIANTYEVVYIQLIQCRLSAI